MTYVKGSLWLLGRNKPEGGAKAWRSFREVQVRGRGAGGVGSTGAAPRYGWMHVANKELTSYADGENVKCERKRVIREDFF